MSDEENLKKLAETLGHSKNWISTYFLMPSYNKKLLIKINELKDLLDTYNWGEQRFNYTSLPPKSTGLSYLILTPCFSAEGNVPYILIPKKNLKAHFKREHFIRIDMTDIEKTNGDLRIFLELNLDLIVLHWSQIIDSMEIWKGLRKI